MLCLNSRENFEENKSFLRKRAEVFSYLNCIEKSLKEQGFSVSRAGSEDIKRILTVYYEQNTTSEKFDGERWGIPDD